MPDLEFWLLALTFLGVVLGVWGIVWGRASTLPERIVIGRSVFLATQCMLGGAGLVAAFYHAEGLVPIGLTAGMLVVIMLWESPRTAFTGRDTLALPEET